MTDAEKKIRHSAAHMLALAVLQELPDAKLGTGPAIETGFYYDFQLNAPVTPKLLAAIQKRIDALMKESYTFTRQVLPAAKVRAQLEIEGQPLKVELVDKFVSRGETDIGLETVGDFTDVCEGGHVADTKEIAAIELTHFSESLWQGDAERGLKMQRIFGVAFGSKEEYAAWQNAKNEAAERDHRKLGKELDLFTFSELVGSGLALFTPRGTFLREKIVEEIMRIQSKYGFEKVSIPHITKKDLYEVSGHFEKFKDDLFHVKGKGDTAFVMKPMNCPHHAQIFACRQRSYRDLPLRYAEATTCYRDEQPGELLGLSRVRALTQDDGHIFCRHDQIKEECANLVSVVRAFYEKLGMWKEDSFWVSLSVRDPNTPEKYLGEVAAWDDAERFLEEVAAEASLPVTRVPGEAAFYGPKLDFQFFDALRRQWQLATIQIDFVQPERFKLEYTDSTGKPARPVMIHRAIAGSLERFLSVIIEHFAGHFPLWLAPEQVRIVPVSDEHTAFAKKAATELTAAGARVQVDATNAGLGKKIRAANALRIPLVAVVGGEEEKNNSLTITEHGVEGKKETPLAELASRLSKEG